MNFSDRRKQAEQSGMLGSGDYLKLKEGQNRMRLMSECLAHPDTYQGRRNFKWLCYMLDRTDGKMKPFFMPHTIYKALEAFQVSEDFGFEDVPMPYDITINADGAGTKEVKYTVMPGKAKPLTHADAEQFRALKPIAEIQAKLKEKKRAEEEQQREEPPTDDDDSIPF